MEKIVSVIRALSFQMFSKGYVISFSHVCEIPTVLWTLWRKVSSNNQKVSIILLRSSVFVVLAYWVGKLSIKLPRTGSFFNMAKCP